eukprot:540954_1
MSHAASQPVINQNVPNNLATVMTPSQCVGNAINVLKTSSQSYYFANLHDSFVQRQFIRNDIIRNINVIIECEHKNDLEFIEFDEMQRRILKTYILKWKKIIELMKTFQDTFTIIFENEFRQFRLRSQQQQSHVPIRKPPNKSLALCARDFAISNIKMYLQDDNFNWDKYRKYKIIAICGDMLTHIHNNMIITAFSINDPQNRGERIKFELKRKKELYSETGIMKIADWCQKVLAIPRIQSFNVNSDIEKLSFLWDAGWTDELFEIILLQVRISGYPLFIPNYRILNKNILRNILKANNLEDVAPIVSHSNKQQEFEDHLLTLQQQITDNINLYQQSQREYDELRQEFDEYKVSVISEKAQANIQTNHLRQEVEKFKRNEYYLRQEIEKYKNHEYKQIDSEASNEIVAETNQLKYELNKLHNERDELKRNLKCSANIYASLKNKMKNCERDKNNEINNLKKQLQQLKLSDKHSATTNNSNNDVVVKQKQIILGLEQRVNRITDINRYEMNQKERENNYLTKTLKYERSKNKQLSWAVENKDVQLMSLYDSNIKQPYVRNEILNEQTPQTKKIKNKISFESTYVMRHNANKLGRLEFTNNRKRKMQRHTKDLQIDHTD